MVKQETGTVIFRVQRYDPEAGTKRHFQEFTVPVGRGTTVLDGLIYIKENLDSTLSFRTSCRMAICGSCAMMVNHFPHLACHTQIEEFRTKKLILQPLPNFPIIKDLVADLTSLFQKHRRIKPYLIRSDLAEINNPTAEYKQSPAELNSYLQFSYCIKCGICVAACPTSASDRSFLGPQALAQSYHYCADSRDAGEAERLPEAGTEHGVWHCHLAGACAESCPKGLDPALAIQLLKRRLSLRAWRGGQKPLPPASPVPPPMEKKPKIEVPEYNVK